MSPPTILDLRNISRTFGGLKALYQVSLTVDQDEILGLIGPNGAGKTTLLNVIAGACPPSRGTVHFAGEDITGLRPEARCRRGLARTFQIAQAFARMSVLENVMVAAVFGGARRRWRDLFFSKGPEEAARRSLNLVEFPLPYDTPAGNLNTAELKRLDLARALAGSPRLLLLDEIFAGLLPQEGADLARLLRAIHQRGVTLLLVEHLMQVINQECTRVVVLCSGEKIGEGSPSEVARDPKVIDAYLGTKHSGL